MPETSSGTRVFKTCQQHRQEPGFGKHARDTVGNQSFGKHYRNAVGNHGFENMPETSSGTRVLKTCQKNRREPGSGKHARNTVGNQGLIENILGTPSGTRVLEHTTETPSGTTVLKYARNIVGNQGFENMPEESSRTRVRENMTENAVGNHGFEICQKPRRESGF